MGTAQDIAMAAKKVSPLHMKAKKSMKARSLTIAAKSARPSRARRSPKTVIKTAMKKKLAAMKKAMKKKPKKVRKASTIAKGNHAKTKVWLGRKVKTSSGLKKDAFKKNKDGKVVSKKKSAQGRKMFGPNLAKWVGAFKAARKELGLTGFVATKQGSPLYNKTKELYD